LPTRRATEHTVDRRRNPRRPAPRGLWALLHPGRGSLRDLIDTNERPYAPIFRGDNAPDAVGPPEPARRRVRETPPSVPALSSADSTAPEADMPQPAAAGGGARIWAGGWRRRRVQRPDADALEQRSLFGEVLDWMFAPLLLLWPLSVALTFLIARSLADAPFDRALDDRTEALAQQVRIASDRVVVTLPRAARDFLATDEEDVIYFQVIGARGQLLAGEADLPRPGLYDYPVPGEVKLRTVDYRGDQVRIGYLYIDVTDGQETEQVLVQVAETLDKRSRLANEIIKGVIFPQFMILPVAVLLVWFGLSRGLAPLKSLQRRIRNRAPDDLSPIDPRGAPEEIAPLVDAFNDLLDRLHTTISVQKRFIADAAHQMKTPLAGLSTQSELALRERDPAELRRTLEQIARGSQRAAHLVSQLLALARTENLREAAALAPLELADFAREAVSDWVPAALARGIDLGLETGGAEGSQDMDADADADADLDEGDADEDTLSCRILGHPILLRELLNNLVDNALRYTPRGGSVTIRVAPGEGRVFLEVEDSGPGIPEGERELVFERFYRVLGTGVDGSGLGLPIVREIADQHGASIEIDDAVPGGHPPGTLITVAFPVVPA
jgi:two-component system sensor histidine kinase TctE